MINKRMSALSYLFKLLNFKDVTKKFIVRQILRSYRKEQPRKDRRRPISLSLLNKLFDQLRGVCFSGYEENLFKLAFSLAFYGAFRISKLVSKDKKGRGGLLLEDIHFSENHLSIYLPFIHFTLKDGCFWKKQNDHFEQDKRKPNLSCEMLREFSKSKTELPEEFRFERKRIRIGAATQAKMWGLDPRAIKKVGRWNSERYKLYVRPQLLQE
ncbi:hypothetical protein XELAEV_18037327mg [Xenopus laevis]|uniref:Uncharacterized protein n=1 Tax=Xenopus laevis TaxID=8355 RepID=A0A974CC51_XENLA|nr:hypothetical protein XELAEV_18037327mg [Xenopus laevis]